MFFLETRETGTTVFAEALWVLEKAINLYDAVWQMKLLRSVGGAVMDRLKLVSMVFRSAVRPIESPYAYQREFIQHQFRPGERVLDIGSGGDPFPDATVLADRCLQPTSHRSTRFESQGKPVVTPAP